VPTHSVRETGSPWMGGIEASTATPQGRPMTAIVVGFAGAIGSGKTAISTAIAEARNLPRVSFGDFVRAEARRRGLDDTSREVLQGLGEVLIVEGWEAFCAKVLDQAAWQPGQSLVVEGIRHAAAVHTLRAIVAPVPFVLIFLNADEETRRCHCGRSDLARSIRK